MRDTMTPMDAVPRPPVSPTTLRCVSCKYDLSGTAVGGMCPECGTPVETTIAARIRGPEPPLSSGLATASLVLGIIGLCMWLLAPIALALSIAATRQMKHAEYSDGSKAAATVGGVLGFLGTILLAAIFLGDLF